LIKVKIRYATTYITLRDNLRHASRLLLWDFNVNYDTLHDNLRYASQLFTLRYVTFFLLFFHQSQALDSFKIREMKYFVFFTSRKKVYLHTEYIHAYTQKYKFTQSLTLVALSIYLHTYKTKLASLQNGCRVG
jgi:hypothetical protein